MWSQQPMAVTNQAKRFTQRTPSPFGPSAAFAAAVMTAFVALAVSATMLPKDFALAAVSTLFFAFAALVALIAWRLGQPSNHTLSYWDVAGVLTLCGICAATLMDAEPLVQFIESQRSDN
jgi:hypothetical protein